MRDDYEEDKQLVKHIRIIAVVCLVVAAMMVVGGIERIPVVG